VKNSQGEPASSSRATTASAPKGELGRATSSRARSCRRIERGAASRVRSGDYVHLRSHPPRPEDHRRASADGARAVDRVLRGSIRSTSRIPIRPVVHYMMAASTPDIDGGHDAARLYAAGETACVVAGTGATGSARTRHGMPGVRRRARGKRGGAVCGGHRREQRCDGPARRGRGVGAARGARESAGRGSERLGPAAPRAEPDDGGRLRRVPEQASMDETGAHGRPASSSA